MDSHHTSCFCGLESILATNFFFFFFSVIDDFFHRLAAPDLYKGFGHTFSSSFTWKAAGKCYPAHHHSLKECYLSCWTVCILITRIKGQLQKVKVIKRISWREWQPGEAMSIVGVNVVLLPLTAAGESWGPSCWRSFWAEELALGWFFFCNELFLRKWLYATACYYFDEQRPGLMKGDVCVIACAYVHAFWLVINESQLILKGHRVS